MLLDFGRTLIGVSALLLTTGCGSGVSPGSDSQSLPIAITGPAGQNGQPCSVASTPTGAVITCPDGTHTTLSNGLQGPSGVDIASVMPIQFCHSSFVPSYPNSFPESGLCINEVLYGVYSANGGFLAELPPGTYSSDGINASCTFTIEPGCVIIN